MELEMMETKKMTLVMICRITLKVAKVLVRMILSSQSINRKNVRSRRWTSAHSHPERMEYEHMLRPGEV